MPTVPTSHPSFLACFAYPFCVHGMRDGHGVMSPLGFDFDPRLARKPEPGPVAAASALAPEGMARQLEQHLDQQVMHRLVPRHDFGPAQVQALLTRAENT